MSGGRSLQIRLILLSVLVALLVTIGCVFSISWNSLGLLRELQVAQAQEVVDAIDRQLQERLRILQRHTWAHARLLTDDPRLQMHDHNHGDLLHAEHEPLDALYLGRGGRIERSLGSDAMVVDGELRRLLAGLLVGREARSGVVVNDQLAYLFAMEPVSGEGYGLLGLSRLDGRRLEALDALLAAEEAVAA
ncbi:MAG: hypothetical protein ACOCXA_00330, partial [Planctomycetota bacterium]